MIAKVYIARHERHEAAEAYVNTLSPKQIEFLKDNEGDYWMYIDLSGKVRLDIIEDEG